MATVVINIAIGLVFLVALTVGAVARVAEWYTWEGVVDRYERLFESLAR